MPLARAVPAQPGPSALFADLRQLLAMSPAELAASLGTRPEVILALERGDVGRLPPWPETERIVTGYLSAARIDPRPVLATLAGQMSRPASAPAARPRVAALRKPPARRGASKVDLGRLIRLPRLPAIRLPALPRVTGVSRRRLLALGLPVVMLFVAAQMPVFSAAEANVPAPVSRLLKGLGDKLAVMWAPRRDGFAWIEVADPRQRRGDKLQSPNR